MTYQDLLKDTSAVAPDDNNKFIVTVLDLDLSTTYPIQFRWKYKDGSFGLWSPAKFLLTPGESFPDTPRFLSTDVVGGQEYISVTWGGLAGDGNPFTNYDRIDVYINGAPFDGNTPAASFKSPGTQILKAPQGEYIVSLYAVSVVGTRSAPSADHNVIVTALGESVGAPTNPNGFSALRVLAGVQLSWAGTYANGTFTGFEAIKVYAGTSALLTNGTYVEVGVLTGNNVKNTITIPVDGTYVKYGQATYLHAAAVNRNGVVGTIQANVASVPLGPGKATDADINDGAVVIAKLAADVLTVGNLKAGDINATSYIRAGTKSLDGLTGARVEISSAAITQTGTNVLAGLHVYNSSGTAVLSAPLTGGLTINGGGTFTGDLSVGSGLSKFGSDANGIWLGSESYGVSSPFRVSRSGVLTAISGTIGGWSLATGYLANAGETFKISSADSAIYVGNSASTHLRISASGGIGTFNGGTPTSIGFSLTTSGVLTATSGTIAGWTIGTNTISKSSSYTTPFFGQTAILTTVLDGSSKITLSSNQGGTVFNSGDYSTTFLDVSNLYTKASIGPGVMEVSSKSGTEATFGVMPAALRTYTLAGGSDIVIGTIGGRSVNTSLTKTASGTKGSNIITVNNTTGLAVDMYVSGPGIPAEIQIVVISGNNITLGPGFMGGYQGALTESFTNQPVYFKAESTVLPQAGIRWLNYDTAYSKVPGATPAVPARNDLIATAIYDNISPQNIRPLVVDLDGRQFIGAADYFSTTVTATPSASTGQNGDFFFSTA